MAPPPSPVAMTDWRGVQMGAPCLKVGQSCRALPAPELPVEPWLRHHPCSAPPCFLLPSFSSPESTPQLILRKRIPVSSSASGEPDLTQ